MGNANITYHSLDKFFNDTILPNIQNPKVSLLVYVGKHFHLLNPSKYYTIILPVLFLLMFEWYNDVQVQTEVRKIRQTEMKRIEEKVSLEINHSINIIINWIKVIFKSKQEKVHKPHKLHFTLHIIVVSWICNMHERNKF